MQKKTIALIELVTAMLIYAMVGFVRKEVDMPSGVVCMIRGLVGGTLIYLFYTVTGRRPKRSVLKERFWLLFFSGIALGLNWATLFQAFSLIPVGLATMCNYLAPTLIIVFSAILFKEKLHPVQWVCVGLAFVGMVMVSGLLDEALEINVLGVVLGLASGVSYAVIVLLNKRMVERYGVEGSDRTAFQLIIAGLFLLVYAFVFEYDGLVTLSWTPKNVGLMALLCVVFTMVAYIFYYNAMGALPSRTVAMISYLDPVGAVVIGQFIVTSEQLTSPWQIAGCVLIITATAVSENAFKKNKQ